MSDRIRINVDIAEAWRVSSLQEPDPTLRLIALIGANCEQNAAEKGAHAAAIYGLQCGLLLAAAPSTATAAGSILELLAMRAPARDVGMHQVLQDLVALWEESR